MTNLVEQVASELEGRTGMDPDWEGLPDLARSLITLITEACVEKIDRTSFRNYSEIEMPAHELVLRTIDSVNKAIRKLSEVGE